jgi:Zn-dependent protease with chaperone function
MRVVCFVLVLSATAVADPKIQKTIDAELERRFREDVAEGNPAAAIAWDEANAARQQGRFADALDGYRRAIGYAPEVDHPHRRACGALLQLQQVDEAIRECEKANDIHPESPYNKSALAQALGVRARPAELDRALELARASVAQLPADPSSLGTLCQLLIQLHRDTEILGCADRLIAADPDGVEANFIGALAAATRGDFDRAGTLLDKAHAAGLDDATYERLRSALDAEAKRSAPSSIAGMLWIALFVIAIWLAVMLVLLVAGYVLSAATLRAADGGAKFRRLYRVVLAACGVYFYLSMPILVVGIIAAGGGLIVAFLAAGYIPIKLVLIIGFVVVVTVAAIARSLFVRGKPGSLGHRLELADHPRLRTLLDDVAHTVGTRPVDAVYVTPGTEMAVTERAGLWSSLRHKRTERSLIMGVALFDGMPQIQLRSILAHEHGHFRNEDTAGGGFALLVRRSLFTLIVRLAMSGAATRLNPVWWFLRGYHRVYLGISQGASRMQEVLADRWAIEAYGTAAFVAGYRHVVERDVRFAREVSATIKEVAEAKQALPNLYAYRPASPITDVDDAIAKEMAREPDRYDSHPSPKQRIERAEALAIVREPQPDDGEPVWALFADREALERAMTDEVRTNVRANHGIEI